MNTLSLFIDYVRQYKLAASLVGTSINVPISVLVGIFSAESVADGTFADSDTARDALVSTAVVEIPSFTFIP